MNANRSAWRKALALSACAVAALMWPALALAEVPGTPVAPASSDNHPPAPDTSVWLVPGNKRVWLGIDLGQSRYSTGCGFGGYRCKNPDLAGRAHVGGLLNRYVGVELGYLHLGDADRAGGTTSAQGVNLSLLGRLPVGNFTGFAKLGGTFGRTEVTADPLSGVVTGTAKGWGASWGAGLTWEASRQSSLVIEWERHDLRFPGAGRHDVQLMTLGYRYGF
jgi:hypothetical protein